MNGLRLKELTWKLLFSVKENFVSAKLGVTEQEYEGIVLIELRKLTLAMIVAFIYMSQEQI